MLHTPQIVQNLQHSKQTTNFSSHMPHTSNQRVDKEFQLQFRTKDEP